MLGSAFISAVSCNADYKTGDTAEPEGEMYSRALNMLLPYLLSWRTRLARADAAEQSPSPGKSQASPFKAEGEAVPTSSPATGARAADSAAQSPSAEVRAGGQQQPPRAASPPPPPREQLDLQRLTASQRRHLAVLLDTALLKVMRLSPFHFVRRNDPALHSSLPMSRQHRWDCLAQYTHALHIPALSRLSMHSLCTQRQTHRNSRS